MMQFSFEIVMVKIILVHLMYVMWLVLSSVWYVYILYTVHTDTHYFPLFLSPFKPNLPHLPMMLLYCIVGLLLTAYLYSTKYSTIN